MPGGQPERSAGPTNVAYGPGAVMPPANRNTYDWAGNLHWFHSDNFKSGKHDHTRHYYGADDRLRASERWTCRVTSTSEYSSPTRYDFSTFCQQKHQLNSATAGSFEEYRYDALGRRVLVRSRRKAFCTSASCAGTITRTVWNGDEVFYEIRAPGDEGASTADLENDNVTGHPFYGRVTYTHGGGIDHPLEVIRMGYTPQPQYNGDYQLNAWGGPHPMILHTDWRGMVDKGTTAFGRRMPCQQPLDCPVIRFPAATYRAYNQDADLVERQSWYGSLIEEKSDDSGLMYMRNRYYNPATGSFTQEDPIGIAGGLNTYGFANGDPATYSDPYGLSAGCKPPFDVTDCPRVYLEAAMEAVKTALGMISDFFGVRELGEAATGVSSQNGEALGAGERAKLGSFGLVSAATNFGGGGGGRAVAPLVRSGALKNIVRDLYKGIHSPQVIGTGSTADAIRYELRTGCRSEAGSIRKRDKSISMRLTAGCVAIQTQTITTS